MLFNSALFFFFFPIVTFSYFLIPHRFRWMLLLGASCFFYMCFIPVYILLLFYMIAVDYAAGLLLEKWSGRRGLQKLVLGISLCSNFGMLFFFKYFPFVNENLSALARLLHWNYSLPALQLILPLGLSFHTFQSLTYIIEVYRGSQKAERHLGIFALYVLFYPQLTAGPIERSTHLLPQFYEEHPFDYERVTRGLKRMTWGFFQKLVIADRVALYVNQVYAAPSGYTSLQLALATFFFAFQIYCDFCGYTDIALGAAEVMGFRLMQNFRQPYLAQSIPEFWRRWHISLSSWFRDYLYIPLGGNRVGEFRHAFNLFFTFLVSGLWHGANWTFAAWGALHGIYMLLSEWMKNLRLPPLHRIIKTLITFTLVSIGWIFFRANNVSDALYILTHLAGPGADWRLASIGNGVEFYSYDYYVAFGAIAFLIGVHILQEKGIRISQMLDQKPPLFRWGIYYATVFTIWLWGASDVKQFIYFQF